MKNVSFALLLMATLAFVLVGCSDNPGPVVTPVSPGVQSAPSLAKTDGPGAWIFRQGGYAGWVFFDPENQLLAAIGFTDVTTWCETEEGLSPLSVKVLILPDADPNFRRLLVRETGVDVTAVVWHGTSWPEDWCQVFSSPPVAVGTVKFTTKTNDVWALDTDRNNVAFGEKAEGPLTGPDGQAYRFNLTWRIMWDPGTRVNLVMKMNLAPTGKN